MATKEVRGNNGAGTRIIMVPDEEAEAERLAMLEKLKKYNTWKDLLSDISFLLFGEQPRTAKHVHEREDGGKVPSEGDGKGYKRETWTKEDGALGVSVRLDEAVIEAEFRGDGFTLEVRDSSVKVDQ